MTFVRPLGRMLALALLPACVGSQAPQALVVPAELPRQHDPRPTTAEITEQDLMTRIYVFADDSMQGRATGTPGYRRATDYIERELRRLGLQPAGENGTFFQPLSNRAVGAASRLTTGGEPLQLWRDFAPLLGQGPPRPLEGAGVVYGGTVTGWAQPATPPLRADQVANKVVLLSLPPEGNIPVNQLIPGGVRGPLAGAAAVFVVGLERLQPQQVQQLQRGSFGGTTSPSAAVPYAVLVTREVGARLLGADPTAAQVGASGAPLSGEIVVEATGGDMARNVVAIWPGSDPALRGQYVALGAHADHVGFNTRPVDHDSLRAFNAAVWAARGLDNDAPNISIEERSRIRVNMDSIRALGPARLDSINNGADDDASGSMALLEIAEALALGREKPRRSVLFVWHAAEEMGLLGARHFVEHPTVPLDSIVAHINLDMVGRGKETDLRYGGLGYVGLIGARRLSTQLGDLAEQVNRDRNHNMRFDYGMDADGHPQNIYCRSDHFHYARKGIPIAFFFTGLHGDYHQVTDEPQYIFYPNYTRITRYIHDFTLAIANRDQRLVVDRPRMDPNAPCRQ